MKRAILYARVSSEDQLENYSIDTQFQACEEHAAKKKYAVVDKYWDDISGAEIDRPSMNRILALARKGAFDVLVCYDIDRFARDFVPLYLHERELSDQGVSVEYVSHHFDDSPSGEMQKDMLMAFAKFERKKIKERSIRGRIGKAREGKVPMLGGGRPRYGYYYQDGDYIINEEQAGVVRCIFEWYTVECVGIVTIAQRLTESRIPTGADANGKMRKKTSKGHWSPNTVLSILRDETYIGNYYYNRTIKRGKRIEPRPRSEWIKISVPPIIDEATFKAAQEQRQTNKSNSKRNTQNFYLMQFRLYCACCGYKFQISSMQSSSKRLYYYRCPGQERRLQDGWSATCHGHIRYELVDNAVWNTLKAFLSDTDRIRQALLDNAPDETIGKRIADIEKEIASLKVQQSKLLDLYLDNNIPRELLNRRGEEINTRLASFEEALSDLVVQQRPPMTEDDVDELVASISLIQKQIDNATDEQKRFVVDALEIRGTLDRDTKQITLEGLFPPIRVDYATGCCTVTNPYRFSLSASYST